MLLYNHKQEFIGITEEGLRLLNYATLEDLLSVCSDAADLFANEPGYIHNFKGFGWIDFLLHADSDASSAIVHGNGRTLTCRLNVTSLYMCENPSQSAYSIEMLNVKSLSGEEIRPQTHTPKPTQTPEKEPPTFYKESVPLTPATPAELPDYTQIEPVQLSEPSFLDIPQTQASALDDIDDMYAHLSAPLSLEELGMIDESKPTEPAAKIEEPVRRRPPSNKPMLGDTRYSKEEQEALSHHKVATDYVYDPHIAANELGLPVDLIEEFIGDFIQQSHDFKESMFDAVMKSDFNNLHILSHKLKGVAANLRVEDAFETLSIINTSTDVTEIEANLKFFYTIVAKLEGKDIGEPMFEKTIASPEPAPTPSKPSDDDIYDFGLKLDEHDSLIVQENQIHLEDISSKIPEFKKESLPTEETFRPIVLDSIEDDILPFEPKVIDEAPVEFSPPPVEEPSSPPAATLHYDIKTVAGALGIEISFMETIVHEYKEDAQRALQSITNAISAFDTLAWQEHALKLKGISDNLRLGEISEELAILVSTNDAQEAKNALARLSNYLNQL